MPVNDAIPVVMIHKAQERAIAKFHCTLHRQFDVNVEGWKLAHIESDGLKTRAALNTIPMGRLVEQFLRLVSPDDMFVIPLAWEGLAEVDIVVRAYCCRKTLRIYLQMVHGFFFVLSGLKG